MRISLETKKNHAVKMIMKKLRDARALPDYTDCDERIAIIIKQQIDNFWRTIEYHDL